MKKLVFLLVFIAIAWGVTPFGIGFIVQDHYDSALTYYKKELGPAYAIEQVSYERGYMTSTATYKVNMVAAQTGISDVEFIIVDHIKHMPNFSEMSMATVESELQLPAEIQQALDKVLGGRELIQVTSHIGFDRTTTTTINSEAFDFNEGDLTFKWLGMNGTATVSSDFKSQTGSINFPGFSVTEGEKSFGISDVTFEMDFSKGSRDLNFGNGAISFGNMHIVEPSGFSPVDLAVDDLRVDVHASEANDAGDYEVGYSLRDININGIEAENIALNIAIRNFDNKMMADLTDAMEAINTDPSAAQMVGVKVMGNIKGFIDKHPEFEISKLYVELPGGTVEGHFLLGVIGDWDPSILMGNTAAIMGMFKIDFGFSLPESMLNDFAISQELQKEQMRATFSGEDISHDELYMRAEATASQNLFNMTNMGILINQNGVYSTEISYENGKLQVNGKDMTGLLDQLPM